MKSKKYWIPILFVVFGLFVVACGSATRSAATVAIKVAEDSWNAVKGEVVKYIPDQAKGVEDAIKGAKENFDKGNFDAALAAAKAIPDKVKELTAVAAAKKARADEKLGGDERRACPRCSRRSRAGSTSCRRARSCPRTWTRRSSKAPRPVTRRRPRCGTTRRQPSPEATWQTRWPRRTT